MMGKKDGHKRVLMIISLYWPHFGGAEQQARLLAKNLLKRNCSVCVLTRKLRDRSAFEVVDDVPVFRQIRTVPYKGFFGLTYMISVLYFLFRMRARFDLIHCHEFFGFHCIVSVIFGKLFKKKVIALVTSSGPGSDFLKIRKSPYGRLFERAFHNVDRLITLCRLSSGEAVRAGFAETPLRRIPNGVDTAAFAPASEAESETETVLFVGRLIQSKGVQVLLEAFGVLAEERADARLAIVGDGPMRKQLETAAGTMTCRDRVFFYGNRNDIVDFMKSATVFVLPSFVEGLPNALLEAMSCGLPVVASRVGGIPDAVSDGDNGILVSPGSGDEIEKALKSLFSSPVMRRRLGKAARETIKRGFSIQSVADRYVQLYQELMDEGP